MYVSYYTKCYLPYSGKLSREKTFADPYRRRGFRGENLHGLLETNHRWVRHASKFHGENFVDGSQSSKSVKVFSLEGFSLYGMSRFILMHV